MPKKYFAKDGPTPAERKWAKVVAAWRGSGQTGTAFCRQRQLKESAFRFWLKELEQRRKARRPTRSKSAPPKPRRAVGFVAARLVPMPPRMGDFEIHLGGGRRVRVSGDFDPPLLKKIVATLEAPR